LTNFFPPEQEDQTPAPESGEPDVIMPLDQQGQSPRQMNVVVEDRNPVVTYAIIAVTVIVFLLQMGTEAFLGYDLPVSIGIKYNPLIDQGEYWRLIAPVLLHGDFLHIGFNMYALYILGRGLEPFYGHGRFLLLYLAGGFAGATASYLLTASPSLGASTATFGLLAAYGVLGFRNKRIFGKQSQLIVRNVVQVALINFVLGLSPGIDNWGHFGGALGGLALAWFGGPVLDFSVKGTSLHIQDQRKLSEFLVTFVAVFGFTAALALLLNGKT
jgi:rhomboid protease GluP